ncbi:MAG: AGE family epimerase/isomerase [Tannerella sp.]|nr:AGE family epimerase/isomerase [Tannerella sp.]
MREEVLSNLITNILPFWEVYSPDPSGGFYGAIANDGAPDADADKALALNARILWTFSSAYHTFEVESYKQLADRAQRYLIDYFIDPEYGGAYWSLTASGQPADTNKYTYAQAFAIYAFSEHYRATAHQESLEQAIALYTILQNQAYDPVNGGYIDSFTRNWQLSGHASAAKTMNTHIHLLEAFTNLYRVWPDKQLKEQLKGLLTLFFTMEWNTPDETHACAHDMEASWLLCEAAGVTGDKDLIEKTKDMSVHLVETRMREAWNPQGYLSCEKTNGETGKTIEWWPQAEAVVAFINAWQLTGNSSYATAAATTWNWIKENLVDLEYGEWYYRLDENNLPITTLPKADMWKCPYHNSRMAFEALERIGWHNEEPMSNHKY